MAATGTDTLDLASLPAELLTAATENDAQAVTELFARLQGQSMGKAVRIYADGKYHWLETNALNGRFRSCVGRKVPRAGSRGRYSPG
jgi:hypothetical protein